MSVLGVVHKVGQYMILSGLIGLVIAFVSSIPQPSKFSLY